MLKLNHFLRPINVRRDIRKHVISMFSHFVAKAQVYDIGCGSKPFTETLENLGCKYIGVDLESGFYSVESVDLIGSAYSVPVADGVADAVLSIQVIEHLERPRDAFLEAHRILKPGGVMIVSFPFLYPIHATPFDYMRYTNFFLASLAKETGFEVLEHREISGFWYVTGVNFGLYLQAFDRGILKMIGLTKIATSLIQWSCLTLHFLENQLFRIPGKKIENFRSIWPSNYVFALKNRGKMSSHDKYWDKEQTKRLSGGYIASKKRHDTITLYIKKNSTTSSSKTKVLNIGVGNGYLEEVLLATGHEVFCLDPSEIAIAMLRKKLGLTEGACRAGGVESIPFDSESFDFVVMSEVIEHLEDDILHKGLEEVRRILKYNGVFLGTVPCNEDLSRETFRCPSCMQSFHRVGHVRSYLPNEMKNLLSRYLSVRVCHRFLGMHLNWKGYLLHQWNDFPFKRSEALPP